MPLSIRWFVGKPGVDIGRRNKPLGTLGLIVPANTARPSSSFVLSERLGFCFGGEGPCFRGLRCFSSARVLRTSKVTYHVGVIAHPPTDPSAR